MVSCRAASAIASAAVAAAACGALLLLATRPSPLPPGVATERQLYGEDLLPSTYLNYVDPTGGADKKSWFSRFESQSSGPHTFFAVQRTQYGYLGIQETETLLGSTLRRLFGGLVHPNPAIASEYYGLVIFSVWNTESSRCQTLSVGDGAFTDNFSGEGTGCQIKLYTEWGNRPYHFITTTDLMSDGNIRLTGYWVGDWNEDDWTKSWKLVGSIRVANEGRRFGEGGISTFIEQFRAVGADELRMAKYGAQFVEDSQGTWNPISSARFTETSSNHPDYHSVAGVVDQGSRFAMGVAGVNKNVNTPVGSTFQLTNPGDPRQSIELQSFIRLRNENKLPTGCVGASSCNYSPLQWLADLFASILPHSLLAFVFFLLVVAFILALTWTVYQCWLRGFSVTTGYVSGVGGAVVVSSGSSTRNYSRGV